MVCMKLAAITSIPSKIYFNMQIQFIDGKCSATKHCRCVIELSLSAGGGGVVISNYGAKVVAALTHLILPNAVSLYLCSQSLPHTYCNAN